MTKPCADVDVRVADSGFLEETPSIPHSLYSQGSRFVRGLLAALGFLLVAANADAIVIDFSGLGGELGTSVEIGGIVIDGFYFNGSWMAANLFQRDEDPEDHGMGVCNPQETCSAPGGGDINELDNADYAELIRLTLPAGFFWTEVGISSMDDNNSQDEDEFERGQAFATDDPDPANAASGAPFWQFAGNGLVELTHPVAGTDQFASYIFFQPFDWAEGKNTNNDFLVWQATIEPIPEPGTVFLFAGGLLGLLLAARHKKSS